MKSKSMLEADRQSLIMIYLTSLPRSFFWRQNTGAALIEDRFIRFGLKGAPDIQGMLNGVFVGVEVKSSRGKQREEQQKWQDNCDLAGGVYILAKTVDKVKGELSRRGFLDYIQTLNSGSF